MKISIKNESSIKTFQTDKTERFFLSPTILHYKKHKRKFFRQKKNDIRGKLGSLERKEEP